MKFRKLVAGAAALAAASSLALAGQAQAADTPLEFSLANGLLSVAAPTTKVTLTPPATSTSALPQFTGNVATTVTDERNSLLGWQVSASVTNFVRTGGGGSVAASNVLMLIDAESVVTNAATGAVFVPTPAVAGSGVIGTMALDISPLLGGDNTVSYDLGVTVAVPANTPDGTYTSTLTQTVV